MSLRSGVAVDSWLDNPRALLTALECLRDADAAARRRGR